MHQDEEEIRHLASTWLAASKSGDVDALLSLLADDAVFLVPGQPVMRKADFAAAARAHASQNIQMSATSEIQEVQVFGEWAFMVTKLRVTMTPPGRTEPIVRAGHTLSVLQKTNGTWVLARDANLLAPIVP
ncbi:MAG: SgcJ/EcaC family oxidoreductase [Pseudomonadota bacterium]|nr:SgcJ/EcaC family oxidoreductase [Pseudomonadota bacterium]